MIADRFVRWPVLLLITAYTLFARLIPYMLSGAGVEVDPSFGWYPWNFSPVLALCLFSGAAVRPRWAQVLVPLTPMLLSDLGIGLITGRWDWAFYPTQVWVYGSLVLCVAIGRGLRERMRPPQLIAGGLASAVLFFLITNFAVWLNMGTYAPTWQGLMQCYVAAIPYFRNSLLGTALFGLILLSPLTLRTATAEAVASGRQLSTR